MRIHRPGEPPYGRGGTFAGLPRALDPGRLAGADVVEVSPPYDDSEITALLAHRVVEEALSGIALRRLGREPAPERSHER